MPQRQITMYQALISQARAYRTLRAFMTVTLQQYNLTLTEWLMIGLVIDAGKEGARISELAHQIGVELPVITNLVKRAEASGWVTRSMDDEDRRAKRVVATLEGSEQACDIEGKLREATSRWLNDIDPSMLLGYLTVVGELSEKELPAADIN